MNATSFAFVLAIASCRSRFDPLYTVNCKSPLNIPSVSPLNVTLTRSPSVFTVHRSDL